MLAKQHPEPEETCHAQSWPFSGKTQHLRSRRRKHYLQLAMLGTLMLVSSLALWQTTRTSAPPASGSGPSASVKAGSILNTTGTKTPTMSSLSTFDMGNAANVVSGGRAGRAGVSLASAPDDSSPFPAGSSIFSPYIEVGGSLQAVYQSTGLKFFTLAFMLAGNGCQAAWDGSVPLADAATSYPNLASDIQAIRDQGGDIKISFGGGNGTELALACKDPTSLQAQYQAVINQYHVTYLDFDLEGGQEANSDAIARRNIALTALQKANPGLQVSFTLPAAPDTGVSEQVLSSALVHGTVVSQVNAMAMDYDTTGKIIEMGQAATAVAQHVHDQLQALYAAKSSADIWSMIEITPMIGQNNSQGEIFTLDDATTLLNFAETNQFSLAMWSVGRDNGGCAGSTAAIDTCSGITQDTYAFIDIFIGLFPAVPGTCIVTLALSDPIQHAYCFWTKTMTIQPGLPPEALLLCQPIKSVAWLANQTQPYQCNNASDGGLFYCNVPINGALEDVTILCSTTQGGPSLSCQYTYLTIGACNPPCDQLTPVVNEVTGLPLSPPVVSGTPAVCPITVPTCSTPDANAQPVADDWLLGSTNGLLLNTSAANTYNFSVVQTLWPFAYGLAMALIAIPLVLGGLQIMRNISGQRNASAIELFIRALITAVAASLSLFLLRSFIDLENGLVNTLFAHIPAPPVVTSMPSANWSCYAHQFFGSIFNISVYTSQNIAKNIKSDAYVQDIYQISATLIVNLGYYILTLLSVLLAIQLVARLAFLNVYIIVSPLTIICSALPGVDGSAVTQGWLRGFAALLFTQVVQLLILWGGASFVPVNLTGGTDWVSELFARLVPIAILGLALGAPRLFRVSVTDRLAGVSSSIGGSISGIILLIRGV